MINLILTNVRSRRDQAGDMNAQLGAVTVAERRLTALVEKYGVEMIRACVEQLLDLQRGVLQGAYPQGCSSGAQRRRSYRGEMVPRWLCGWGPRCF